MCLEINTMKIIKTKTMDFEMGYRTCSSWHVGLDQLLRTRVRMEDRIQIIEVRKQHNQFRN